MVFEKLTTQAEGVRWGALSPGGRTVVEKANTRRQEQAARMISQEDWMNIKEMAREGRSIREIARMTGLARQTEGFQANKLKNWGQKR